MGKSKCLPTDHFSLEHGKELAYTRAMIKLKKRDESQMIKELKALDEYIDELDDIFNKKVTHLDNLREDIKTLLNKEINLSK